MWIKTAEGEYIDLNKASGLRVASRRIKLGADGQTVDVCAVCAVFPGSEKAISFWESSRHATEALEKIAEQLSPMSYFFYQPDSPRAATISCGRYRLNLTNGALHVEVN